MEKFKEINLIILAKYFINVGQYLKDNLVKEKLLKEQWIKKTEINIRVNSMMIWEMEKVNVSLKMGIIILEIGLKIRKMDTESSNMLMEISMKEIFRMIENTVKEL